MKKFYSTLIKNICFIFSLAVLATSAYAAPANDNFANAQLLSGNNGTIPGSNVGATKESGEPVHALNRGGASIWYKHVAPANGVLRITASASFNTLLAVYKGSSLNNLTLVTANDDNTGQLGASTVYFGTQSGATYYIAVDGKYFEGFGTVTGNTLSISYSYDDAMPNDHFVNAATLRNDFPVNSIALTNVGASKEIGEPNHANNGGGKSVWFKWQSPDSTAVKSYTFRLEPKDVVNPGNGVSSLLAVYTGSSVNSLTEVAKTSPYTLGRLIVQAQPNTTYYIAVDGGDFGTGAQLGNFILSVGITKSKRVPDFDRDSRADISVYRPSNGTFYSLDSITGSFRAFQWGATGDKPMFNEIDGDGKIDYCVFRPGTQVWYFTNSNTNDFNAYQWGAAGDIPFPFDIYNQTSGYYFSTIAIFRPSTGTWWIPLIGSIITYQFGLNGDIPMIFDYDGDGTDEIAVFRPSTGTWYLANPYTGQFIGSYNFGLSGDIPTPADYDGDGMTDIAIFRPSTGDWWFRNRQTGAQNAINFGTMGDKPQPADYDGDGKADIAVFRSGVWWILQSSNGNARVVFFGLPTDIPITSMPS